MAENNSIGMIKGMAIDVGIDVSQDNWHEKYQEQLQKDDDDMVELMADLMVATIKASAVVEVPENMRTDSIYDCLRAPFREAMQLNIVGNLDDSAHDRVRAAARHLLHACD